LAWYEAVDQIGSPIDWYVQAISSAMGVYGTFKGAKELLHLGCIDRLPHLLCVQQDSCSPMVAAWNDDSEHIRAEHIVSRPSGIADAILRGDPTRAYPYIRKIVKDSGGAFSKVSEPEIREARRMVEELEGISPCFSASTAVAGLIKLVRDGGFPCHSTVLINLTGGDRDSIATNSDARWLIRTGNSWTPKDLNDERTISLWSSK
jgi:threonine synthase